MRPSFRFLLMIVLLTLLLISSFVIRAHAFTNGQSASLVIGQKDFTSGTLATTQSRLWSTGDGSGLAFDSSGNLWVADHRNNRVLEFEPPFSNGMNASTVIGQPDFVSKTPSIGKTGLNDPIGITFDSVGNLWVGDVVNRRLLEFEPPFSIGMSASLVIGQPDFTTKTSAYAQNRTGDIVNPAFDSSGNLWAPDFYGNRVLEFKPPFSNGMNASLVIGQKDFTSSAGSASQNRLSGPQSVVFDSSGNLWICDGYGNNRILEFQPPFGTGMQASLAIGQPDFRTSGAATSQTGLNIEVDNGGGGELALDSSGNLWVGDYGNNRVLEFKPPFSTGMPATLVIGQKDFTTALPGGSGGVAGGPDELLRPGGVAFDNSGNLWVFDTGNNRILEFSSTPVPEFPIASLAIVTLVSLAVAAIVSRRFPVRGLGR